VSLFFLALNASKLMAVHWKTKSNTPMCYFFVQAATNAIYAALIEEEHDMAIWAMDPMLIPT
jgi:hypothetical protein